MILRSCLASYQYDPKILGESDLQIDRSAQAAYISVAVMLRAVKTAVHALIAEISP